MAVEARVEDAGAPPHLPKIERAHAADTTSIAHPVAKGAPHDHEEARALLVALALAAAALLAPAGRGEAGPRSAARR